MPPSASRVPARKGFTLVELAVVIVIIGVLAAFGVPKFLNSVEKSKAAEAFNYLSADSGPPRSGTWHRTARMQRTITSLDITLPAPQYFTVGSITPTTSTSGSPGWSLTLDRNSELHGDVVRDQGDDADHLDDHDVPGDLPGDVRSAAAVVAVVGRQLILVWSRRELSVAGVVLSSPTPFTRR